MDAESRRLLSETHAKASATAEVVQQFIEWSKEVHQKRDAEMDKMCDQIKDHDLYIRLLKWFIAPLTPIGVLGALAAFWEWVRHPRG